jgi:spore coat protein U-like protein
MTRLCARTGLAFGLALFFSLTAIAGVGTATFTAQTTVNTNCTISTSAVAFGSYDPIGLNQSADLNSIGTITIACVKGTAPTIGLNLGGNASGSTRRMQNTTTPGNFLPYELYQPSGSAPNAPCTFPGTTVWGDGGATNPNPSFNTGSAPNKNARTYNVCGTIAAGQNPLIGNYQDTVVATVNF